MKNKIFLIILATIFIFISIKYPSIAFAQSCINPPCDCDDDGRSNETVCGGEDCDDNDPNTYGGANEICDGKDNNCDTVIPQNERDEDNDGYVFCSEDECDDTNNMTNGFANEICDGKDNNCDTVISNTEKDWDTDGFMPCQGDCNDNDPSIKPNATEICNDNLDNDCDNYNDCSDLSDCAQNPVCTGIPEYPSVVLAPILTIISIAMLRYMHIF